MTSNVPPPGPDRGERPTTGDPVVDDALTELDELATLPLADHHDRLVRAHEVLQGSLDRADPATSS